MKIKDLAATALSLPTYPIKAGMPKRTLLLSLLFSAFTVVGRTADKVKYQQATPILRSLMNTRGLLTFAALAVVFYLAVSAVEMLMMRTSAVYGDISGQDVPDKLTVFFAAFAVILLCYTPYFISNYPAVVTSDSNLILRQAFGADELYNHHPVLYTLFISLFCRLGRALFGSNNAGVALAALAQLVCLAAAFAYTVAFLAASGVKKAYYRTVCGFFALFPLNGYYAVTITKDVPFAAVMLLFTLSLIRLIQKRDSLTARTYIAPSLLCFVAAMLRSNAIFVMPVLAIFLVVALKSRRVATLVAFGLPVVASVAITSFIFPALGIKPAASTEYIAVPLQQTARIVVSCDDITDAEKSAIEGLMPLDFIREKYNPTIVDPLKFRSGTRFGPAYDTEYLAQNKIRLARLWAGLCARHPLTAADAYICLTLGYWYPENYYNPYGSYNVDVVEQASEIEVYNADCDLPLLDRAVNILYRLPIIRRLWNVGLWTWLLILFAVICGKKNGGISTLAFVPILLLTATLFVATPIFAEKRYMYAVPVILPVLICAKDMIFSNGERSYPASPKELSANET